ncbi:MAG: hypothetical protein KatS3mg059_0434 [Thermomicrobiales bacterium]|nr:MAG: hypothetical protein KatS3mg059_0434 [Thermomicrobiales bacterium]
MLFRIQVPVILGSDPGGHWGAGRGAPALGQEYSKLQRTRAQQCAGLPDAHGPVCETFTTQRRCGESGVLRSLLIAG